MVYLRSQLVSTGNYYSTLTPLVFCTYLFSLCRKEAVVGAEVVLIWDDLDDLGSIWR